VPAEEQGEVVADIVESAGGTGASADRTVEEAPEGLGGWEVFMGVEVAVVVESQVWQCMVYPSRPVRGCAIVSLALSFIMARKNSC
jgi:hypothetical protein